MSPSPKIVSKPRLLFRPDPVLGWSLSPGHAVRVGFRDDVLQTINPQGWRTVAATGAGPRIAFYGCSFTYGTGLRDEETFTTLVQRDRPALCVLNRGIGGHGTVQNFLQFRRDAAAGVIDAAVFGIISDHRFRNIAHPQRMRQYLAPEWYALGVEHVPVARLDAAGKAGIVYLPIWQPVIRDADFQAFLPDDYMINAATFAVIGRIVAEAKTAQLPLSLVLLDQLDPGFNAALMDRFPQAADISTPYDTEHTFMPRDIHPNVRANALFAQRLLPIVDGLCAAATQGGAQ